MVDYVAATSQSKLTILIIARTHGFADQSFHSIPVSINIYILFYFAKLSIILQLLIKQ